MRGTPRSGSSLRRPCRLNQQRTAAVLVIVAVYGDAIVLFPALVVAVGLGLAFVPVTIAAVTGTRPDEAGLASGLINTSQQVGGALGLAILVSIADSRTASLVSDGVRDHAVALSEGFQTAFLVGAGFAPWALSWRP